MTADSEQTTTELTPESALTALTMACANISIPAEPYELVRIGTNAVYRLAGNIVARVGRSSSNLDEAAKQVAVSNWLASVNYPAVRALELEQPVVADGRVVTFWESVSDTEEYAPIGDVAALIRDLHALTPPKEMTLPKARPLGEPTE